MPKNLYPRFNPRGKINEVLVVVSSAIKVEGLVVEGLVVEGLVVEGLVVNGR